MRLTVWSPLVQHRRQTEQTMAQRIDLPFYTYLRWMSQSSGRCGIASTHSRIDLLVRDSPSLFVWRASLRQSLVYVPSHFGGPLSFRIVGLRIWKNAMRMSSGGNRPGQDASRERPTPANPRMADLDLLEPVTRNAVWKIIDVGLRRSHPNSVRREDGRTA